MQPGQTSHHSLNRLSDHEIAIRHTYHRPHSNQQEKYEAIRAYARGFAHMVNDLCPGGREASVAQTKIEEAVFWANAAIARREPDPETPFLPEDKPTT